MEQLTRHFKIRPKHLYLGVIVALAVSASFLGYQSYHQSQEIEMLLQERNYFLLETASSTVSRQEERELASSTIAELSQRLALTAEELNEIENDYRKEKKKNDNFEDQIREISGTVGVLDKLSRTDKELLQKYSKVYFLNEHYVPEKIVPIEPKYLYNEAVSKSIHANVEPFLNEMLDDALADGIKIWVVSGYRSFKEQATLKGAYTTTYGSGANAFSADQGFSEHQLGTAVDLTTEGLGGGLQGFDNTPAYKWMQDNAYKYGFTLSYPKGNAYYIFEPWHWRFVGKDLARDLKRDNAGFYDWEQRKIDEYLISIFD